RGGDGAVERALDAAERLGDELGEVGLGGTGGHGEGAVLARGGLGGRGLGLGHLLAGTAAGPGLGRLGVVGGPRRPLGRGLFGGGFLGRRLGRRRGRPAARARRAATRARPAGGRRRRGRGR